MTCEEAEALGLFGEEHLAKVAVAKANLAVFGNGAGDAEGLKAFTDCSCCVGSLYAALFESDCAADGVCPNSVFKADGLGTSDDFVNVDTLCKGNILAFFNGIDSVLFKDAEDLIGTSFIVFK